MTPIGIFDSGIGGLSVARALAEVMPEESFLYVADNAYAPYGPRSPEEVLLRSRTITGYLLGRGVKMIVVACNTATSLAIDALRAEYPGVPFVGMEPAVKPAAAAAKVGVMATAATLKSERYLALRKKHLKGKPVYENACVGLVPLIEAEPPGSPLLMGKLEEILRPLLGQGIDALVLGCTHYPMISENIAAVCGPMIKIIDPSMAAAKQAKRLLSQHGLRNHTSKTSAGTRGRAHNFLTTGNGVSLQRTLLRLPELNRDRKLLVPHTVI